MSESDFLTTDDVEALANLVEMIAQDEEGAVDKAHGEAILAMTKDAREGRNRGEDPVIEILRRGHQARVSECLKLEAEGDPQ